ncbi:hypothetical protein AXF42_Ash011981 [Apostasia shenzhenica]|uniref:START domain-containing protein n=1 Tax=Apostasia shenzhenica TaxID=1088818 RepID=A0A2I0AJF8_9ASPA|nr:hypothetical protein AXF42_Ash011981 [Apostasia shenzhenica]
MSQHHRKMEGWLYLIRSNRIGLQFSRKRYFVLQEDNALNCYKSIPTSRTEDLLQSAQIDSCTRVTDNGRENIHRNVLFIFTLYNASNHNDHLKMGARSSEEAAKWIRALMEAALKLDWTAFSSIHSESMASDVIAPSPWTIFGCKNGLRLFKEAKDGDLHGKFWDDHPAIMAVGVIDATSEAIFRTVMSLGPSRSEWDFCFAEGALVEHLDGHTDIIHKKLKNHWLPWSMKSRDLLLRRYWRREDDGTYVILYHSVFHQKCQPERGYIRACLKSGGYVISPINLGKQSVVKHMLAIDWKFWKSYLFPSSAKQITICMLERIAALRELFRAKLGNQRCFDSSSGELTRDMRMAQTEIETTMDMQTSAENNNGENMGETDRSPSRPTNLSGSLIQLNDAADEFFDFPDESEYEQLEPLRPFGEQRQPKLSTASGLVKRLHDLAAQKRGYIDLQEALVGETAPCNYGTTLQKDPSCSVLSSWTAADPSTFLIRSETYLRDQHKVKASGSLMQMVAADWIKSDKREDDLGGRQGGIVKKYADQGGGEFFFIVHIQVPGSTTYSLALYYMMDGPVESVPLLKRFVEGDDVFRNSRFKLIPYISKGSWIVKQSVGKKACLVGQALEINYFRGQNYLELGVNIGSSTVARGVVSLVLGYLSNLVIEMAFLIQGNTEEELPEFLLGTCRLNHLDASKAVSVTPWKH